jgi:hypothetical protein
MSRSSLSIALAGSILLSASAASAWAPETRVRMVDEAVRFMPASLRLALENNREPLLRGMLEPMRAEDGPEHRPPWSDGSLDSRLEQSAKQLLTLLGEPTSFADISVAFGNLAHYILDAGFPPGMTDGDGATRFGHFAEFCESRRERFPLVFYGHEDPNLAGCDYRAFGVSVMTRAMTEDRLLSRAYAAAGDPPNPSAFDDRSVPFAVGSLSYSRSVTDIVRIWLAVWNQAGGDMGRTPYSERRP